MKAAAEAKKMWKGLLDRDRNPGAASGAASRRRETGLLGSQKLHLLPGDLLRRVMERLTGQKLFMVAGASKTLLEAQHDAAFWEERIARELHEGAPSGAGARELKEAYRQRSLSWARAMSTFGWLRSRDCPSDVHGTKSGPWSSRTLAAVLAELSELLKGDTAEWRRDAMLPYARVLCALLSNTHENIQEMAAACLAHLVQSADGGRALLTKHGALKPLQRMLQGSARGLQKQASRALVNAWLDLPARVVSPCPAELLDQPHRTCKVGAHGDDAQDAPGSAAGRAEWLCVEFSPSGAASAPYALSLSRSEGRLHGVGEDSFGAFRIDEATVNRSKQWAVGASVDAQSAQFELGQWDGWAWGGELARAGVEHRSSAEQFPELLQALGLQDRSFETEGSYESAEQRVGGWARRRSSAAFERARTNGSAGSADADLPKERRVKAGTLLEVHVGIDHVELLKTYDAQHGNDHVRYVAFGDGKGLWGFWERGHYYHQHKMDACTRGAFRMWAV